MHPISAASRMVLGRAARLAVEIVALVALWAALAFGWLNLAHAGVRLGVFVETPLWQDRPLDGLVALPVYTLLGGALIFTLVALFLRWRGSLSGGTMWLFLGLFGTTVLGAILIADGQVRRVIERVPPSRLQDRRFEQGERWWTHYIDVDPNMGCKLIYDDTTGQIRIYPICTRELLERVRELLHRRGYDVQER